MSSDQFRNLPTKAVTLLGMSGVGKTSLGNILPNETWFHYSGDYRIGTKYLAEPILDNIKRQAMQVPFLRDLLRSDSIYICNNITIDNLDPISTFLGKIGNPELGGLAVKEYKRRQRLHRNAEIGAMHDVRQFMEKSASIYAYPHFLNDAGGSVCHLNDDDIWNELGQQTLVLYLRASKSMEQTLITRSQLHPKPLYYGEEFLDQQLANYLDTMQLTNPADITPDSFAQWLFPHLIAYRKPLYTAIAERHGYTIDAEQIFALRNETDFIEMVCDVISSS